MTTTTDKPRATVKVSEGEAILSALIREMSAHARKGWRNLMIVCSMLAVLAVPDALDHTAPWWFRALSIVGATGWAVAAFDAYRRSRRFRVTDGDA